MMSVHAIRSAAVAGSYFEADDYYTNDLSPSTWAGNGADALGLSGEVDRQQFRQLLEGRLPNGEQLGTVRNGELQHRPGWDLTFSAPKSVSILAEVGGDHRLIEAHDRAVQRTLEHIERALACTRVNDRAAGEVRYEQTSSLVAALFRHDTSRALDPDLHTHAVVMNATLRADGQWRSLEAQGIYIDQKNLGLYYRQQLAEEVRRLGYEVTERVSQRGDVLWDVAGVPEDVLKTFSKRSEAIDEALAERGKDRSTATAAERETATLNTRDRKIEVDRSALQERWREELRSTGQSQSLEACVMEAKQRCADPDLSGQLMAARMVVAAEAVAWAAEHLGERETSWSHQELVQTAMRHVGARATQDDIERAVEAADDLLIQKSVRTYDKLRKQFVDTSGYTSRHAIEIEDQMLATEYQGRDRCSPILSQTQASGKVAAAERAAAEAGYEWNAGQRKAAIGILSSENRVVGVQGYAGTAKTTTVLRTVAEAAQAQGYEVVGMAPTSSAAQSLAEGAGIEAVTIQRYLNAQRQTWRQELKLKAEIEKASHKLAEVERALENPGVDLRTGLVIPESSPLYQRRLDDLRYEQTELQAQLAELQKGLKARTPEVWIIDEASMVGTRLMRDLLTAANQTGARVVLTGDQHQLASVEAGAAFRQLQEHGMETYHLQDIVRQRNTQTRDSVYLSLMRNARSALERIERGGGEVVEAGIHSESGRIDRSASGTLRRERMVHDYMALTPQARERSLLIEPSRAGREELNRMVRSALRTEGGLQTPGVATTILRSADATGAQLKVAATYRPGHVVRFQRAYKSIGASEGYYEVVGREGSEVILSRTNKAGEQDEVRWKPAKLNKVELYERDARELSVGETIVWTKNDAEARRVNGQTAQVEAIRDGVASIRMADGSVQDVDLRQNANQHWDYGYALTAHAAQGRTAEHVFVHAESWRTHLLSNEAFYVQVSRARDTVALYTDSRAALISAIQERSGQKQTARESRFPERQPPDLVNLLWHGSNDTALARKPREIAASRTRNKRHADREVTR